MRFGNSRAIPKIMGTRNHRQFFEIFSLCIQILGYRSSATRWIIEFLLEVRMVRGEDEKKYVPQKQTKSAGKNVSAVTYLFCPSPGGRFWRQFRIRHAPLCTVHGSTAVSPAQRSWRQLCLLTCTSFVKITYVC